MLVVDDHTLFRESLCSLMERNNNIEVVGEAADGVEAIAKVVQLRPDVVLMDVAMHNVNGVQATRRIKRENNSIKVLALTMYETEQYILEMLCAGASGYISKRASASELISAIQAVRQGDAFLYPSVAKKILDGYLEEARASRKKTRHERLSTRELEVLSLIAEGKKNKEIAQLLTISLGTVQTHRLHLMKKLGMHDCTQLVRYAISEGLITL